MSFYARVTYTANGSTPTFSFSFPYISTSYVKAYVNGVEDANITFPSSSTVTLSSTPANGATVLIKRISNPTARLVDFQDGSVLSSSDLDTSANQNFYMAQETDDEMQSKLGIDTNNVYDASASGSNLKISNVADPTSAQDVATKNYIENTWLSSSDKTALASVNSNITNINAVNSNATNINSAVSNATNINTVATNIGSVNTVATDITKVIAVANDLAEAVSEIETVADDLNETSSEIDVVAGSIANVNTVGGAIANVNTVAGANSNITTLAGISSNITSVANISSDVTSVAGISSAVSAVNSNATNINAVNSNSSNINTVAGMSTAINTVNSNSTNINTVAGANTNITNVAGGLTNINTVATNLASVNNFAEVYRISANAPTSSLTDGDMWFDTTADKLKIWNGSSWDLAGSSVNGTSARFKYVATANQTTFTGSDANGNTLAYDSGYIDVYLNGVHLDPSDYTATDGSNFVLASGASVNDELYIVAFGTFSVSSIAGSAIDSGTINLDRLPSITNAKLSGSIANDKLANNSITINGSAVALGGSVTVGETKPTATGCTPSTITNDATNVVIAGTNFVSIPQVWALNTGTGIWYLANSVSYTSATSITANFTLSVDAQYKIRVENPDGNATLSGSNLLTVSDEPTWSTASGSLGSFAGNFSGTLATLSASSDSTIAYSETTSVLTGAGVTLNTSTGALTTTDFGASSTTPTTYNFTIRATDGESQTTDRTFSMTSTFGATGGGQFN